MLSLYDPDRSQYPVERTGEGSIVHAGDAEQDKWAKFDEMLGQHLARVKERRGASFYVLSEATSSPTLARLRQQLLEQMPEAQWLEYEPLTDDHVLAGARAAFGKPVLTQLALDKAQVILCLDADLLAAHPASLQYARAFAKGREVVNGTMNRLYVVESAFSRDGCRCRPPPAAASQPAAGVCRTTATGRRTSGGSECRRESGGPSDAYLDKFVSVLAQRSPRSSRHERRGCGSATASGGARRGAPTERAARQRRTDRSLHARGRAGTSAARRGDRGACHGHARRAVSRRC